MPVVDSVTCSINWTFVLFAGFSNDTSTIGVTGGGRGGVRARAYACVSAAAGTGTLAHTNTP